jgi:hypothetical protein
MDKRTVFLYIDPSNRLKGNAAQAHTHSHTIVFRNDVTSSLEN